MSGFIISVTRNNIKAMKCNNNNNNNNNNIDNTAVHSDVFIEDFQRFSKKSKVTSNWENNDW